MININDHLKEGSPNVLALFAGAGGGELSSQWIKGWRTVCYVEWAKYPAQVIEHRIKDGLLCNAPIWDNVRTFDGYEWRGKVDIVTAGFPCQPFSTAGKRKSANDLRNGWPDTIRIVREVKPEFVYLENVRGLLSAMDHTANDFVRYFGTILRDLANSGYDARWRVLSASETGAPHKRDRVWIVAHTSGSRTWNIGNSPSRQERQQTEVMESKDVRQGHWAFGSERVDAVCSDVQNTKRKRLEKQRDNGISERSPDNASNASWWEVEPRLDRVVNGMAHRVDRVKALGNGQVPVVAATAWDLLTDKQQ